MDKVHMTILGNLEIIGWFDGFNLVKVTTLDGTELKLKSAGDYLVGQYRIEESDKEFVETVSSFYASLSSKQEPLGRDFEKVLNENLWDLYGS